MTYDSDERSTQGSQPREGISIAMPGQTYNFATGDQSILIGVTTYQPLASMRGEASINSDGNPNTMEITLPVTHPAVQRYMRAGIPPTQAIPVTIWRLQITSNTAIQVFSGLWSSLSVDRHIAKIVCSSRVGFALQRRLPTLSAGRECPHSLFDVGCTIDRTLFALSTTVLSRDGSTITVATSLASLTRPVVNGTAWDGGASSTQTIAGNGYISVIVDSIVTHKMIGFSASDPDQSYTSIGFALYQSLGNAIVFESGVQVFVSGGNFIAVGDSLRVQRTGTTITYQNKPVGSTTWSTFYTSAGSSSGAVLVDTSIYDAGASITGVSLFSGTTRVAITWTNVVNVTAINGPAPSILDQPDQWAQYGELLHVASGEKMTIGSQIGAVITMQCAISEMADNDAVIVYAGCAKDVATCRDKFANVVNFGGQPALKPSRVWEAGNQGVVALGNPKRKVF